MQRVKTFNNFLPLKVHPAELPNVPFVDAVTQRCYKNPSDYLL